MPSELPSDIDRITYGILYIIFAVVSLPPYALVIFIYVRNGTFRKLSCYWIMTAMGIYDLLSLVSQVALGVRVLTNTEFSFWIEKIVMNLSNATFNGTVIMMWTLALNRFIVLVLSQILRVPSSTYLTCIVLSCTYVVAVFGITLSDKATLVYKPHYLIPAYSLKAHWMPYLFEADKYLGLFCYGSSVMMYVVITVYLVVKRLLLKSIQHNFMKDMVFYIENLEDLYPSTRARIAFGVVYIALAVIAIPVYTLIITIYLRNKTFRKWPCYWIMSVMGVFDVLYLCAEIFMAIMGSVYSGSVIMVFLLAANRFFVLVLSRFFTVPPVFYKICIVSTFVYVAALFGISLSPKADIQYEPLFLMLRADTEKGWIGFLTDMDGYVGFVCFGSTFLMYVIITGYLILQLTSMAQDPIPSETIRIAYGIAYLLLAILPIPLYIAIITIFMRTKKFRNVPCYWIMSVMGIFDLLFLVGELGLGLRVLTDNEFSNWGEKVLLSLSNATFSGSVCMICVLAVNRFIVLLLSDLFRIPSVFYIICIVFSLLYVSIVFIICLSGKSGLYYNPRYLLPMLDLRLPWTVYLIQADEVLGFISFGSALPIYIVIAVYLIVKRFKSSQNNFVRELSILVQGVLVFLVGLFILLNDMYGDRVFPPTYVYTASFNSFMIFYCGLFNPLLYLSMNSELRREMRRIVSGKYTTLFIVSRNRGPL
ncbi:hypothetical protein QR680_010003 [Steinernema hermaphroditum]|uniref:G-protein coupled receptors family 1 profile domain-containing protein n=1 Tax=Steinernema hermaphroditum TaxID=289476 RepID=A0AA39IP20_9BILA|nr:hypothetical protein QR680_010003 [Steinernema hermaphroditum]